MIQFPEQKHAQEFVAFSGATCDTMSLSHWKDHVVVFAVRAGCSRDVIDRFTPSMDLWFRSGETVESAIGTLMCASRACQEEPRHIGQGVREHLRAAIRACDEARARAGLGPSGALRPH